MSDSEISEFSEEEKYPELNQTKKKISNRKNGDTGMQSQDSKKSEKKISLKTLKKKAKQLGIPRISKYKTENRNELIELIKTVENDYKIDESDEKRFSGKNFNEWGLDIPLYFHQQNSVKRMEDLEDNNTRLSEYTDKNVRVNTNVGILSDRVGSGKTLTVISFLSRQILKDKEQCINKNEREQKIYYEKKHEYLESATVNEYFSEITTNFVLRKIFPVSVIVVNSSVYNQWLNELTHSKLKYRIVYKAVDLKDIEKWIFNVDVIVVTYAKYNDFSMLLRNIIRFKHNVDIVVKRLIFDELQLTGKMGKLTADFYWIVSATFKYNRCYRYHSRDLRTNFMCLLLQSIITQYVNIFNTDEDIELSYKQANVVEKIYDCYIRHFNTLLNYLPNEVQRMIAADDVTGAIVSLGGTKDGDIVNAVITKESRKIEEIKASIVYHKQLNNDDKVKEQEDKLYKAENSLKFLKEKLENDDSSDCPICYEEFSKKILTNCCKYLICDKCISKTLKDAKTCPFCRQKLDLSDMIVSDCNASSDSLNVVKKITKGKLETLVEIIKTNPSGKFIVFSEFEKTFFPIKDTLMNSGISYSEVKGTTDSKQKSIRLFKEGKIQVLFLNARNDGTGINLPEATDLILYHKLSSPALENQVFGRALRLGRTENLTVHRLVTPEEQNISNVSQSVDYSQSQQVALEALERERLLQEREDYELALRLQNSF